MFEFLLHNLASEYIEKKQFSRLTPALIYANDKLKTMSDAEMLALMCRTIRSMAIQNTGEDHV